MFTFLFTPVAIYSLHTTELFLTIVAALVTGYLVKLLMDQFRPGSRKNETEELQWELEALQNKFSAEMLRKEEAQVLLQDELKAGEKQHMDLQVQYAKALNHIEQLRKGTAENEELETGAGQQILQNLQDKITRQERSMLDLEQQLQRVEQEKTNINNSYQQLLAAGNELVESLNGQYQEEKEELQKKLDLQVTENEQIKEQYIAALATLKEQLNGQRQPESTPDVNAMQQELQSLREQLKEASGTRHLSDEIIVQKAGITATRIQATQVAETIEQFRDHLTAILRDTYSYEQLLASNERLNENITRLQQEKRVAEEEIVELQKVVDEKQKQEEQLQSVNNMLKEKDESWQLQVTAFQSTLATLNEQVQQKEQAVAELNRIKEQQKNLIEELQHKVDERERLSKEMMLVMKDIETRFAHFNSATEEAVVNGNGEMQYS